MALRRFAPGAEDLWLTDQGYEADAQLADEPWTEVQQAQLNAESEYLAWRDPQLSSFSQLLLRDTRTAETLTWRARSGQSTGVLPGTRTTGLERQDGTPKPLAMFRSPIVARTIAPTAAGAGAMSGRLPLLSVSRPLRIEVWGRARPVGSPTAVQVQASDGGPFRLMRQASTDANGIFDLVIAVPASSRTRLRFQWLAGDGTSQSSPDTAPAPVPLS